MYNMRTYNYSVFEKIISDFKAGVESKKYKKLDYNLYKKFIKEFAESDYPVQVTCYDDYAEVILSNSQTGIKSYYKFYYWENDLGKFLNDNLDYYEQVNCSEIFKSVEDLNSKIVANCSAIPITAAKDTSNIATVSISNDYYTRKEVEDLINSAKGYTDESFDLLKEYIQENDSTIRYLYDENGIWEDEIENLKEDIDNLKDKNITIEAITAPLWSETENIKNNLYNLSADVDNMSYNTDIIQKEIRQSKEKLDYLDYYLNKYKDQNEWLYGVRPLIEAIVKEYTEKENKKTEKENKIMKGFNFDFGSCANLDSLRMSMYGIAVKNAAGTWVSYDPKEGKIIDVDIMNFDKCGQYMFKMPTAISDIKAGDVIVHNRKAMFITEVSEAGKITAVDPHAGEEKTILPAVSPFGFNFVTKIVSMFDAFNTVNPAPSAPFGNMLPFLMMEDEGEIDPMMLMMMMNQGGNGFDMNNPMLMYMMFKDKDNMDSMLPFFLMSGMNK